MYIATIINQTLLYKVNIYLKNLDIRYIEPLIFSTSLVINNLIFVICLLSFERKKITSLKSSLGYMGGYKIMGGYKTKCATGLFLTQNECRKAGSILKQLTGKTYKYSKTWIFSMSTRNYGCYNKDKYIYFNTYTRGTSRTPSARSICKAGSIGKSNLHLHFGRYGP